MVLEASWRSRLLHALDKKSARPVQEYKFERGCHLFSLDPVKQCLEIDQFDFLAVMVACPPVNASLPG